MDFDVKHPAFITCSRGWPEWLAREVEGLGRPVKSSLDTGIHTVASMWETMELNLRLRTAQSVLYLLRGFRCGTGDELYKALSSLPWEDIISPDEYVSVDSRVDTPSVNNSMFPNMKAKDAIVDRILRKTGRRPNSGPKRDAVVVNLFWKGDDCKVYLNTTGVKLSDRGYRRIPHKAPLRETLAAGIMLSTGYDGSVPLVAPMCGSGTLAIEAALFALGRAPGLMRTNFGFMHLMGFDLHGWTRMRSEMRGLPKRTPLGPIVLSDIDPAAIEAARKNARTAGVEQLFEFHVCDFAETPVPPGPGIVVLNPEYGERLGDARTLGKTYRRIGDFFKQKCTGYKAYVLTGNPELAKQVGLRARRRTPFYNAKIECRLLEYEMYEGSLQKDRS